MEMGQVDQLPSLPDHDCASNINGNEVAMMCKPAARCLSSEERCKISPYTES